MGAPVSREPVDSGLRRANIDTAKATRDRVAADMNVTKLQVSTWAADAFLTIGAAQQTVVEARAGVERARVLSQVLIRWHQTNCAREPMHRARKPNLRWCK